MLHASPQACFCPNLALVAFSLGGGRRAVAITPTLLSKLMRRVLMKKSGLLSTNYYSMHPQNKPLETNEVEEADVMAVR